MQTRYQYGTLTLRKRKIGPDVWQWRYMEEGRRKSVLIGTTERLPNKAAAIRAVESRRLRLNADNPQTPFRTTTVGALIDRYLAEELERVRHDTQVSYNAFLNKWIRPKVGRCAVDGDQVYSCGSLANTRPSFATDTWTHSQYVPHSLPMRNALGVDRQESDQSRSAVNAPQKNPPRPDAERVQGIVERTDGPYKTMVLVAGCLGLRAGELMGLQWGDIDWDNLTVLISRSASGKRIYETKTEQSSRPVPLDPNLAEVLLRHKENSKYKAPTDFVFAGNSGQPRWRGILFADHIQPAAERAGMGRIGWHTVQAFVLHADSRHGHESSGAEGTSAARRHQDDHEHLHSGDGSGQAKNDSETHQETPRGLKWYELVLSQCG